ncbi:glycosyltransferase [Phaeobacter sp. PT47_59]|uniref:glycosyltransferase n=1 Tax=Phaeobacter sp. PT47_59 TaxID=3029979 RepID=UPI00237FF80C|nr:glycosyltransferase [Phaeobacter sp. PT47_59]MDE4174893.1 glycosyltransferase [Phaeobacter sp. PT47_59]
MGKYTRGFRPPVMPSFRPLLARKGAAQRPSGRTHQDIFLARPPQGAADPVSLLRAKSSHAQPDTALRALTLRRHGKTLPQGPAAQPPGNRVSGGPALREARPTTGDHGRFRYVDLDQTTIDKSFLDRMPPGFWLRNAVLPLAKLGDAVVVAMADLSKAQVIQGSLRSQFGTVIPVHAREGQILELLDRHLQNGMARHASISVPFALSSRFLSKTDRHTGLAIIAGLLFSLTLVFPLTVFTAFCVLSLVLLLLFTGFRLVGIAGSLRPQPEPVLPRRKQRTDKDLPPISVLVPLYKEAEISCDLLRRLRKLRYPHHLLEVFLVLEEDDSVTWAAVQAAELPKWIKTVKVPEYGDLKTKPRALNYALNHCRGDIIGVWDAEDAPVPDQLYRVADGFATATPDVACLQGVLDYYNPRATWISRCFTLEYASWFRIILQGIARMGLVVPLGGTTMFVRREILEQIGGWDAHNVTEDADLGVRLCRAGYRTQMLASTTYEEANARPWPWIKQRSRWLKGFMVTYLVHMRSPVQLLRDLGWRQFCGFQIFFLCSVGQFLLAPFLWSFWLVALGLPHPSEGNVPGLWLSLAAASLVFFELLNQVTAVVAAFITGRRWLALWAPSLLLYYPMGAIAAYKALYELVARPFFWEKTDHGIHAPDPIPTGPTSRTRSSATDTRSARNRREPT